jgi:hypothetical protein
MTDPLPSWNDGAAKQAIVAFLKAGDSPKEGYNWIHVEVRPGQPTRFTLNRFRPWSHQPFESVELFHGK